MSWNPLERSVKLAVECALREAGEGVWKRYRDIAAVADLEKRLVDMELEGKKKEEGWARREREVEHKIGLERKRQEFEIEQAKRETTVKVREENLSADRERFKSEMEFQRKHLEGEIGSLRTLVGQMLERLPSAEIYTEIKKR